MAWGLLGWKMGFDPKTVEPVEGLGMERFFTAETRIPSGVVIRFDGPPGPESGRFVEVERDGASIGFGRWAEHGEYWFLAIQEELDAGGTDSEVDSPPEMPLEEAKRVAMAAAERMRSATVEEVMNDPWTYAFNTMIERDAEPLRRVLRRIRDNPCDCAQDWPDVGDHGSKCPKRLANEVLRLPPRN